MPKKTILVVWSNYYVDLANKQLASCEEILKTSDYNFKIEKVDAGCYEIPAVIQHFHTNNPYDGYIPLGLLLKGSTDHYEFIWEHIKECFIQFALQGINIGNGIISAPSMEVMIPRVENSKRVKEAFVAVDYLIKLKSRT